MKFCVIAICKNEEEYVPRWLGSASEADVIYVNDTGSTDNTIELLSKNPKVKLMKSKLTEETFRFDYARNELLSMIDESVDVCIDLDFDECLNSGWRNLFEQYIIDENLLEKGKAGCKFQGYEFESLSMAVENTRLGSKSFGFFRNSKIYYERAVHENFIMPEGSIYVDVPPSIMFKIHTPYFVKQESNKLNLYTRLSFIDFKEKPTCEGALVVLMHLWGDKNNNNRIEPSLEVLHKILSTPIRENPVECLIAFYILTLNVNKNNDNLVFKIIETYKYYDMNQSRQRAYLFLFYKNYLNRYNLDKTLFESMWDKRVLKIFNYLKNYQKLKEI